MYDLIMTIRKLYLLAIGLSS